MALFLPRDVASVPVSRQVLDGCLGILGVTPDTRTVIALGLGEACANVIQHAGPGAVVKVPGEMPPPTADRGRGLKIMDAVVDNLRLTGNRRQGTTVHFEKPLTWLPGAPGEFLVKEASAAVPAGRAPGRDQG